MLGKEFFTEYGEASQYEIQEVVGKGISYGVVADAVDTQIASSVDYLYDVFPKNFQNGSLIGSGRLNESIPCAQKIAVYLISYKKNEKKEVGVNAFLPTAEAIEVVKHSMQV
ncbi:hypothetical protein L1987_76155 [Smallanthus sonchifolius]|uniref:Uncharacterized protein n=1 Tax=Smallanthus sonchifolius TaxID=185202 RepID=A0ACB9A7E6_9ASTR|nr:hypothetical protein L1987_76155 [Smallanthus sonchifolius]